MMDNTLRFLFESGSYWTPIVFGLLWLLGCLVDYLINKRKKSLISWWRYAIAISIGVMIALMLIAA